QSGRGGGFPEPGPHRLLPRTMLHQPARQFRVLFGRRERPAYFRITRILGSGAVQQQNVFGVVGYHDLGGGGCVPAGSPVKSWCSRPSPRVRRDLTVPSGTLRISAISL